LYPPRLTVGHSEADFFNRYDDKGIGLLVKYGFAAADDAVRHAQHIPSTVRQGAVGKKDTAWGLVMQLRASHHGVDPDPQNNGRLIEWSKDYWMGVASFFVARLM